MELFKEELIRIKEFFWIHPDGAPGVIVGLILPDKGHRAVNWVSCTLKSIFLLSTFFQPGKITAQKM
jgi:hypothetical protein